MKDHIKKALRKQQTNKNGQRSILFTQTDAREETTHAEHVLLSTFRNIIATERSPIAYADFDTWELLRCEVRGVMQGDKPIDPKDLDRRADPLLYLAVDAIAAVIKQRRKSHKKRLRKSQVPTATTEGGTTDAK